MGRLVSHRPILVLDLVAVPAVTGIYGANKDSLPPRMRWLHPDAAAAFTEISAWAVVSDMFRSAESSLLARKTRRGSQRPGYSGHNYGLSIDLDVTPSMRRLGVKTKAELDGAMVDAGWWCHRRDHKREMEDWHYNHGIGELVLHSEKYTSAGLERRIKALYGTRFSLDAKGIQYALAGLGFYKGALDGDLGPLSKTAIMAFQRAWLLDEDGVAGTMTQRTLAYVTATR